MMPCVVCYFQRKIDVFLSSSVESRAIKFIKMFIDSLIYFKYTLHGLDIQDFVFLMRSKLQAHVRNFVTTYKTNSYVGSLCLFF